MKLQEGIKLKLGQVWKKTNFEGGIVPITYCKGRSEKESIPEHHTTPPPPTDADFGASLSFIFKTNRLKTAQKFPATAYSDIEFRSPLLF